MRPERHSRAWAPRRDPRVVLCAATIALVPLVSLSVEARGGGERRHLTHSPARSSTLQKSASTVGLDAVPDARFAAWYELESGPVRFGQVTPGVEKQLPRSVRARVFAESGWTLLLVPRSELTIIDGKGGAVPRSRLSWRSPLSGAYLPLVGEGPVIVAEGPPTGRQGRLVELDLLMRLDGDDELGNYACTFDLILETASGPGGLPGSRIQRAR